MVMAESVWRLQCFAFYAYRLSWFLHSAKIQHVTGRMAVLCHAYVKALCDSLAKLKYMKGKLWNIWLLEQLHTGCTLLILQWKRRRGIVRVLRQTLFILWWVSWKQNLVCGPVIQCNLSCNYSRYSLESGVTGALRETLRLVAYHETDNILVRHVEESWT